MVQNVMLDQVFEGVPLWSDIKPNSELKRE
jgi:hypothetical protein